MTAVNGRRIYGGNNFAVIFFFTVIALELTVTLVVRNYEIEAM